MLYVYAMMIPKKDSLAEFERVVRQLILKTRLEPGCVSFELVKAEIGDVYALVEKFNNKEALQEHIEMDYFKELFPKLNTLLERPVEAINHRILV